MAWHGNCDFCGRTIKKKPSSAKKSKHHFCSSGCQYAFRRISAPWAINECPVCGKQSIMLKSEWEHNGGHSCCSMRCGWQRERRRATLECAWCGKEFEVPESVALRNRPFCSRECWREHVKQTKVEIECLNCGKKLLRTPSLVERVNRTFCSRECSVEHNRGENNPSWRGGKSTELHRLRVSAAFKEWREFVFERDDYTCRECGQRGGVLHPHHIKPFAKYPDLRFDVSNGVTLCVGCHGEIHGIKYAQ